MAPLRDHVTYYYLTLPAIGTSLVGAFAAASAARRQWPWKAVSAAVLLLFLAVQAPYAARSSKWWYERSKKIESVVLAVAAERQLFPATTFILTRVDDALFYSGFWDGAFQAFGVRDTYVDPAAHEQIHVDPSLGDISKYFLDPADLQEGLLDHGVQVLSVAGPVLIDETPRFEAAAKLAAHLAPQRVDAGTPHSQSSLRGAWYQLETDHRWIGKSAGVILAGPKAAGGQVRITGYCPSVVVARGPLHVKVTADGEVIGELALSKGDARFEAAFPLPPGTVGKPSIEIDVELDRTFRAPGDTRELGLVFGSFEIR
jgi:hypothetical protein